MSNTSANGSAPQIPRILEDCLYNVIFDTVLSTHREEKLLRMTSAAVHAESQALQSMGVPSTPTGTTPSKPITTPIQAPPQTTIQTPAATYENGRVYLKGNPLKNMKENYCPSCKLPRLMFPLTGANAKPPDNVNQSYCTLHPFIQKAGHDIYGNPFPVDQTGKTKKERELLKKAERAEKDNTPGSQDTNEDGSLMGEAGVRRLMAGGKPASYVPWHTCPQCKRSLLITKFAQHLEKCLGIGGRAARNVAAARLSGANGSANGSVQGSRVGTPVPSQLGGGSKREANDDDDGDDAPSGPPKKKTKKEGKKDRDRDRDSSIQLKEKLTLKFGLGKKERDRDRSSGDAPKKLKMGSGTATPSERTKTEDGGGGSAKRDRDDKGGDAPRKKMKVAKEIREAKNESMSRTQSQRSHGSENGPSGSPG
jgi:ribonuclease P/MRP protein subunit POP1